MDVKRPAAPTRPKVWTEQAIKKRTAAGLGVGRGTDYRPAVRVQDFSSRGVQSRIPSSLAGRTVHVHSNLERAFFLLKEYSGNVVEFREQFPMERSITLGAAQALGVRHPVYPGGKVPVAMTIDALLTERTSQGDVTTAWDIKPESELQDPRVREKLSLHRAYCLHTGIAHRIFTERSFTKSAVTAITWMRRSVPHPAELLPRPDVFTSLPELMLAEIASGLHDEQSIRTYGQAFGTRLGLPTGWGLRIFQHLAWQRHVRLDLLVTPVSSQLIRTVRQLTERSNDRSSMVML